jgi:hypothetical protein
LGAQQCIHLDRSTLGDRVEHAAFHLGPLHKRKRQTDAVQASASAESNDLRDRPSLCEPGVRIDVIHLRGLQQCGDGCPNPATAVAAGEDKAPTEWRDLINPNINGDILPADAQPGD